MAAGLQEGWYDFTIAATAETCGQDTVAVVTTGDHAAKIFNPGPVIFGCNRNYASFATVRIQGATLVAVPGKAEFPAEADARIPLWNAWKAPIKIAFSK
ncbi:hypothetical protein CFP56_009051 [Quercus suber]|uniref:Uncharacterized protein n=1 Tax=Quercus suber TaxID=58331 RepID=A0AAW0L342_QUESU